MSAIVGIYNLENRPVAPAHLAQMVETLAFRGPDGNDIWHQGPVGLGHLMLHTTQESLHETLPWVDQARDLVLTADARIDNRAELSDALGLAAETALAWSDSQFILAAYVQWGEECPKHLLGDFAFVIWDGRHKKLFGARDHFGVKPFYYHYAPGHFFAFATEIKALLCLDAISQHLNENWIADLLQSKARNVTDTVYADISRLAPAHNLSVQIDELKSTRYWALDPEREIRLGSNEEYAAKFREIFEEAVRCRLRSAVPIGTMLSGGMDSSSISCTARNLRQQEAEEFSSGSEVAPLPTFSGVFDVVTVCDERKFINPVLAQGGFDPTFMVADSVSPLTDLDRVMHHQDEPLRAGNLYLNWEIYKLAQTKGVQVILDGYDGDTTVSHGTGYLIELASTHRWLKLYGEVRAFAKKLGEPGNKAFLNWVLHYGWAPLASRHRILRLIPKVGRAIKRRLKRRSPQPANAAATTSAQQFLNPDFARRTASEEQDGKPPTPKTERENHYLLMTDTMVPSTLELLSKAAAAFEIETRFPFWDVRLAEFCLALPPEQKLKNGWSRLVMRRAAEGVLPVEVQWRDAKTDMSPGFSRGLLEFESRNLEKIFHSRLTTLDSFVNVMGIEESYSRFLAGIASEEEVMQIWRSASLALWLQSCQASS